MSNLCCGLTNLSTAEEKGLHAGKESLHAPVMQTTTSCIPTHPCRATTRPARGRVRRAAWFALTLISVIAITVGTADLHSTAVAPGAGQWVYPVGAPGGPPDVVRPYDPPARPWLPGNRGVKLGARPGSEVRAASAGEVTYAGPLAGRGVLVIRHGDLRTTYEPVDAEVTVGQRVSAGEPVGTVAETGSRCAETSCLHWGALRGDSYIDPFQLVRTGTVRLLPLGVRATTERPPDPDDSTGGKGDHDDTSDQPPVGRRLHWPVASPYVTSPFGMRTHPITGQRRLHDGTDFRAPCGTPIRAAASGTVTATGSRGAYGRQVTIDHGQLGETDVTTSYSHLSAIVTRPGAHIRQGQILGRSGTTGRSTGCHLHFMVYTNGSLTDPMAVLPTAKGHG